VWQSAPWQLSRLAIDGGDAPPAFMVRFDAGQFDPSLFSRHGVAVPASIARSVQKRQAEFFFGRYCASMALAELGMRASEIAIGASREPVWPGAVIGSITHTGTVAAAIALPRGQHSGVGIDIEHIVGVDAQAALRSTVVNADEFAYLSSIAATLPLDLSLTIAFSAKESFFKAVFGHVRRHIGFDEVMVADLSPSDGTIVLELRESLSDRLRQRQRCQLHFREMGQGLVLTSFLW
jgi:4'-phosphopantetheinyl transferase EntD